MNLVVDYEDCPTDDLPLFVFENELGTQFQSATLKCCFAQCDELLESGSGLKLKDLSISIDNFREIHHNSGASESRDKAIENLQDEIAKFTCLIHRTDILDLFRCYVPDNPERVMQRGRKARRDAKKLTAKQQNLLQGASAAETSRPKTPTQQSHNVLPSTPKARKPQEQDYFATPSRPSSVAASSKVDASSPFTASPDSIFDRDLHSPDAYTPATEISKENLSTRKQWERSQIKEEESPTRRRSRNCAGPSLLKKSYDDESFEERPADAVVELDEQKLSSPGPTPARTEKQVVEGYNNALKSPKNRSHYINILQKSHNRNTKKKGVVYIAWDEVDPNLEGLFKVGWTSNTLFDRYRRDSCERKRNMRFVAISKEHFVGAELVEKLIQAEFYKERMQIKNCAWCSLKKEDNASGKTKGHQEWFKVGFKAIIHSSQQWEHLLSLATHDEEGILSVRAQRALEKLLDPRKLAYDMAKEMARVSNLRGLPIFSTPEEMAGLLQKARGLQELQCFQEPGGKKIDVVEQWRRDVALTPTDATLTPADAPLTPTAASTKQELTEARVQNDEPDSPSVLQIKLEEDEDTPAGGRSTAKGLHKVPTTVEVIKNEVLEKSSLESSQEDITELFGQD